MHEDIVEFLMASAAGLRFNIFSTCCRSLGSSAAFSGGTSSAGDTGSARNTGSSRGTSGIGDTRRSGAEY